MTCFRVCTLLPSTRSEPERLSNVPASRESPSSDPKREAAPAPFPSDPSMLHLTLVRSDAPASAPDTEPDANDSATVEEEETLVLETEHTVGDVREFVYVVRGEAVATYSCRSPLVNAEHMAKILAHVHMLEQLHKPTPPARVEVR